MRVQLVTYGLASVLQKRARPRKPRGPLKALQPRRLATKDEHAARMRARPRPYKQDGLRLREAARKAWETRRRRGAQGGASVQPAPGPVANGGEPGDAVMASGSASTGSGTRGESKQRTRKLIQHAG